MTILNEDVEVAYKDLRDFILEELKKQQAESINVCLKSASDST